MSLKNLFCNCKVSFLTSLLITNLENLEWEITVIQLFLYYTLKMYVAEGMPERLKTVVILAEYSNSIHDIHRAVQNPLQFYFQGFRHPSIILVGTRHTMMHRHTYILMTNSPLRISLILTQINYYLTLHN